MPPEPLPLATDDPPSSSDRAPERRPDPPGPNGEARDDEPATRSEPVARPTSGARSDKSAASSDAFTGGAPADSPLRARQVQRILRYVAPWSVFKVSFFFYLCLWLIVLVAGVILWTGASSTGAIDNIESFVEELFGLQSFAFEGGQMFRGALIGGFALVVVGTAFNVLIAVLFNLISDITGGLRLTVVEVERAAPARRTRATGE